MNRSNLLLLIFSVPAIISWCRMWYLGCDFKSAKFRDQQQPDGWSGCSFFLSSFTMLH
ncbi:hypothetical protein [Glutamicibacter soli]|uniref:hypothetical protein n=1 Tax=Glutamicibacter soli TaxID=453836 RepID=UPI0015EF6BFD|nr:hypothetical protein [Glutamicibacter soli]